MKTSKNQFSCFLMVFSLKILFTSSYFDAVIGKKVKALIIKCFDTKLGEYKVIYSDGSSSYITNDDFDSV